jgi:hypothetical protein
MAGGEIDWSDGASSAFDVVAGEFVVVTPDAADCEALARLSALLRRVRGAFAVDAVFVSEWAGGEPVARRRDDAGGALQAMYGVRLLDTPVHPRCPVRFETMAVVGEAGLEYGTLCCRLHPPHVDDAPLQALQSVARLIAEWFDEATLCGA